MIVALFLHFLATPSVPRPKELVTQLDGTGFVPLPNGEARIVPASEVSK
jgi:hypothetical protein